MPDLLDVQAIATASRSDVGKRRSENQDSCGDFLHLAGERLLILADGMGGHRGGRRASHTCVDAFARVFEKLRGGAKQQLCDGFALARKKGVETRLHWPTDASAELICGQDTPPLGWSSRGFDDKRPSSTVVVSKRITEDWNAHTKIHIARTKYGKSE